MTKKKKNKITRLEIYKGLRKTWEINPKSRIKKSKKKYKRSREKQKFKKDLTD